LIRNELYELGESILHNECELILGGIYSARFKFKDMNYFYPELYEENLEKTASFKKENKHYEELMTPIKEEINFETSITSFMDL